MQFHWLHSWMRIQESGNQKVVPSSQEFLFLQYGILISPQDLIKRRKTKGVILKIQHCTQLHLSFSEALLLPFCKVDNLIKIKQQRTKILLKILWPGIGKRSVQACKNCGKTSNTVKKWLAWNLLIQ